jgi:hypothetical protein
MEAALLTDRIYLTCSSFLHLSVFQKLTILRIPCIFSTVHYTVLYFVHKLNFVLKVSIKCNKILFETYVYPQPAVWRCRVCPFLPPAVWACRVSPLPPPAVWTCRVCPFLPPAVWMQGVSLSTASSMDVQGVSLSTASSMDAGCIPFYLQQYKRAGCTPFLNAGMSDCPATNQYGTGMNRNADAKTSLVPEKGHPVRYRTEIQGSGMPMPAASTSMPMPSYAKHQAGHKWSAVPNHSTY